MSAPADELLKNKEAIGRALKAIAEGYPVQGDSNRYIVVMAPDDTYTIDVFPILEVLRAMGTNI